MHTYPSIIILSNLQFIIICSVALTLLIGGAELLGSLHKPQQKKCIEAGHQWSKTEYVCIAKLKN